MTADTRLYLSAAEAALALGVSKETLYAYVSRKQIRSLKIPGTRRRQYWREDIERLADKGGRRATAGSNEELVSETKITLMLEGQLYYRGHDVLELADSWTIEQVAALLWGADSGTVFTDELPNVPRIFSRLESELTDLSAMERAAVMFPLIERANPKAYDLSEEGFARTGADVMRWYAALLVGAAGPSNEPIHSFLAASLDVPPEFGDLIRRLLILVADHELDPSTYAVRAVANTGVTPYYAVLTGFMGYRGRRLLAGRAEAVSRFVDDVLTAKDPSRPVIRRIQIGESIPGFDSPVYRQEDPRANYLIRLLDDFFGDDVEYKKLKAAVELATELTEKSPEVVVHAVFIGRKLGFVGEELMFAAVGRMAGWIAHAMEQYFTRGLIRPRAAYTGVLPSTGSD